MAGTTESDLTSGVLSWRYLNCGNNPQLEMLVWGFLGGTVVKNLPANSGDMGSSPSLGRSHMSRSN